MKLAKEFNFVPEYGELRPTWCIAAGGVFDAGPARYVKPHNDLMLKLHKMLNKAGQARTEDD